MTVNVAEITTTAFLLGLQPSDFHALLAQATQSLNDSTDFITIWNSFLAALFDLFSVYPGDQTLLAYLRSAISTSLVPLHYVLSYSVHHYTQIHDGATLHLLFDLIQRIHFETGAALFMFGASIPELVVNCLAVLRGWQSLVPSTVYGSAPSPVTALLHLLLSTADDMTTVTTVQAGQYYTQIANELQIQTNHFDDAMRSALTTYLLNLRVAMDDNAKLAQEVELLQALQISLSKSSNAESALDIELTALLLHLFNERAGDLSFGNLDVTVAIFRAVFQHLANPLGTFHKHLLLGGLKIITRYSHQPEMKQQYHIWCSIVTRRLPAVLAKLGELVAAEHPSEAPAASVQNALRDLSSRAELLQQFESTTPAIPGADVDMFATASSNKVWTSLLNAMIEQNMIDEAYAVTIGHTTFPGQLSRLQQEAHDNGLDLQAFLEARLGADGANYDDSCALLDRAAADYPSHETIATVIRQRFIALASSNDVEPLSHLCRVLAQCDTAVDILCIYGSLSELLGRGLHFVKNFTCESVGDPQTAISHFGAVILFLHLTLTRYQLTSFKYTVDGTVLDPGLLILPQRVYAVQELSPEEVGPLQAWFKALFSRDSEGIDDHILRTTAPLTLLRIAPTLFSESLALATLKVVDFDSIRNGCQFFFSDILNWTLVGVTKCLVTEINGSATGTLVHFDVLKLLMDTAASPPSDSANLPTVLRLCRPSILRISSDAAGLRAPQRAADLEGMRNVVKGVASSEPPPTPIVERKVVAEGTSVPYALIKEALQLAQSGSPAGINVRRCLVAVSPMAFLEILWASLQAEHVDPTSDMLHRVAANALVASALHTDARRPPLLPLFLFHFLPRELLRTQQLVFENQQEAAVGLLAAIIITAMSLSFHLDRTLTALATTSTAAKAVTPRVSPTALATRLAAQLKGSSTPVARALRDRLAATQTFVAMFPDLSAH